MASSKPENVYIANINRRLGKTHKEKTNNPFRAGTADVWYSGVKGDLWIEFKYLPTLPKRSKEILPELTPRQVQWLNQRLAEGRNVAVIVGTPDGGVIYTNKEWIRPLTAEEFKARIVPNQSVSDWIHGQVGDSPQCLSVKKSSELPT